MLWLAVWLSGYCGWLLGLFYAVARRSQVLQPVSSESCTVKHSVFQGGGVMSVLAALTLTHLAVFVIMS